MIKQDLLPTYRREEDGTAYSLLPDGNIVACPLMADGSIDTDNVTYIEDFDIPLSQEVLDEIKDYFIANETLQVSEEEWFCPECGLTGTFAEFKSSGVNWCPECSEEVKELPF